MTILVDRALWHHRHHGETTFAHLVSDSSYEELHRFARRLGIPRSRFQGDHYDVPERLRARALQLGATSVTAKEIVSRLNEAGLRAKRRRGAQPQAPSASIV